MMPRHYLVQGWQTGKDARLGWYWHTTDLVAGSWLTAWPRALYRARRRRGTGMWYLVRVVRDEKARSRRV